MALTKDDLQAIGALIDDRLGPVNTRLDKMDTRMDDMHADIATIKEDIEIIKEDAAITREATNTLLEWVEFTDAPSFRESVRYHNDKKAALRQLNQE